jgi:hypothetical protein
VNANANETRRGYDSTSAKDCPSGGQVYLGYNDGTYATDYDQLVQLHPNALVCSIGRFASSRANWYDVENGLLTPTQGVALAKGNLDRGEFAGVYCNESTWPKVKAALEKAKILDQVKIWLAWEQPDENDVIPDYAVGRQYLLSPGKSPGHYDVSSFIDHIPGLDPAPKPKPRSLPPHVRLCGIVVRRWCERYTRKHTHPLSVPAHNRLTHWRQVIAEAQKAGRK